MTARRLSTLLVLAFALAAAAAPASAVAQDNSAVAINTKDDSSLFKLAFSVKQVAGEVIDQQNAAVAYASCSECQTVAIAIQVLIVTAQSPDVVAPTNIALAINEGCDTCTTMALAYQLVVGGEPLRLTREGRRELALIRHELRRLGKEGLSAAAIRDRTAALVRRLKYVLATELVPRGGRDSDDDDERRPAGEDERPRPEDGPPPGEPAQTDAQPPPATAPEQPEPETTAPEPAPAPQQDGTTTSP